MLGQGLRGSLWGGGSLRVAVCGAENEEMPGMAENLASMLRDPMASPEESRAER